MQAAWAWGLEIVPSLRPLHVTAIDLGRTLCETRQGWACQREVPKVSGWALMQTMLHKYEEMQMRLKSQDEELENFHALEKERREHDLLPIRPA